MSDDMYRNNQMYDPKITLEAQTTQAKPPGTGWSNNEGSDIGVGDVIGVLFYTIVAAIGFLFVGTILFHPLIETIIGIFR